LLDALIRDGTLLQSNGCQIFQKRLANVATVPWLFATISDALFPGTACDNKKFLSLLPIADWLMNRLQLAGTKDKYSSWAFAQVCSMKYGFLNVLLSPKLMWKIFTV
jgi:hypothetical protein